LTSISDNTVYQLKVKIEEADEIWTFGWYGATPLEVGGALRLRLEAGPTRHTVVVIGYTLLVIRKNQN
jgi:hypothetical protein